jgi:hypothetical protein
MPMNVRRKQRKAFERFLSHGDERIRRYANEVAARVPTLRSPCPAAEPEREEGGKRSRTGRSSGAANPGEKQ